PDLKAGGRLADQHAQAIFAMCGTGLLGGTHEGSGFTGIEHIVGQGVAAVTGVRQFGQILVQAGRSGIDYNVPVATVVIQTARTQAARGIRVQGNDLFADVVGFGAGAIDDVQHFATGFQQGKHHSARGTTRTNQQNTLAFRVVANTQQIRAQAHAIGIAAMQLPLVQPQRIDGASHASTTAQARADQIVSLFFEGQGYVQATAVLEKLFHRGAKAIQWCQNALVAQGQVELAGKLRMDLWGAAVLDRVTNNAVALGGSRVGHG